MHLHALRVEDKTYLVNSLPPSCARGGRASARGVAWAVVSYPPEEEDVYNVYICTDVYISLSLTYIHTYTYTYTYTSVYIYIYTHTSIFAHARTMCREAGASRARFDMLFPCELRAQTSSWDHRLSWPAWAVHDDQLVAGADLVELQLCGTCGTHG